MFNWMRKLLLRQTKPLTGGRRAARNEFKCRLRLERLEDRLAPATFTDAAPTLNLSPAANDAVAIVANANTSTLALTSGTWTGMDDANVSGNGTATLTAQET